jgi:ethanolamine ammonia-lyase large subunit
VLTIGLDICSTLNMTVTLDDLDWCQDQIMPANPAYLMALPTKNDPMLSYLTTAFQDHVRLRQNADTALSPNIAANETLKIISEMFGKKVNSGRRKKI